MTGHILMSVLPTWLPLVCWRFLLNNDKIKLFLGCKRMFKVFDLFSGAGGMAEGFLQAGFSIPYASDKSEQASLTYQNRHKQLGLTTHFFCGDVVELSKRNKLNTFLGNDKNHIDVITGGPPCQGFSLAGIRNPDDVRNTLVKSYIKILKQVKPKYFVMENVLGILSARFNNYKGYKTYTDESVVDVLLSEFAHIGYSNVKIKTLDASDYGVPQRRLRVIFLGTRDDISVELSHPEVKIAPKISVKDAIDDLKNIRLGTEETIYRKKILSDYQSASRLGRTPNINNHPVAAEGITNHQTSRHTAIVLERFTKLKQGENIKSLLSRLSEDEQERLKTKKNNCKKILPNEPAPTMLTLPDDVIHYSQSRILTVREMARIQSFDDSFEFLGKRTTGGDRRKHETPQYTLVGNAVPPLLAFAIAKEIKGCLMELGYERKKSA